MPYRLSRRPFLAALALASAVSAGTLARAEDDAAPPPSAEAGRALTQKLCAGCHVIGTDGPSAVTAGIPTFKGIADKPGQTAENIERKLIAPHAPMPDISLSYREIDDIIAFLDSLRTDKTLPPLLPPQKSQRPKPATPS